MKIKRRLKEIAEKFTKLHKKILGLSLKTKILLFISSFSVIIPAVLLSLLISSYYYVGVEKIFGDQVSNSIEQTAEVAKAYLTERINSIKVDLLSITDEIQKSPAIIGQKHELEEFLNTKAQVLDLSEILVFTVLNNEASIIAQNRHDYDSYTAIDIPHVAIENVNDGSVYVEQHNEDEDIIKIRGLCKIESTPFTYITAYRTLDQEIAKYINATESSTSKYLKLKAEKDIVRNKVILIFIIFSIFFFCITIYIAHKMGVLIVQPINDLVKATSMIELSKFDMIVPETGALDEIGLLSQAFNQMLQRIAEQHHSLIKTRDNLDERMKFIETILSELSAGVIVLNHDNEIILYNASSLSILRVKNQNPEQIVRMKCEQFFPELQKILQDFWNEINITSYQNNTDNIALEKRLNRWKKGVQTEILREYKIIHLLIRIGVIYDKVGIIKYFVITFDDVTELSNVNHLTAWTNVARRVAHEIKNPLTPIQLSIERLQKKFFNQISKEADLFEMYVKTITTRVDEIQKMVSDFLLFSHIASPKLQSHDLIAIIKEVILLYQNSHENEIKYFLNNNLENCYILCDRGQIAQVLINLFKNASESIITKMSTSKDNDDFLGEVIIDIHLQKEKGEAHEYVNLKILDNGTGIAPNMIGKITEPYVTTKSSGTGLGLSITRKIVDEHGGELSIKNREDGVIGACTELSLKLYKGEKTQL